MAGPLTWRNVDAPNFAPAFEGLRTASTLLNNATRSGMDVVGQFQQAQSDAADRAILNRALGVQDSGQFAQQLADGTLVGPDGGRASLETLRGLDSRVGTLLNRDVTRQGYEQTGYTNQRGRQADSRMDAASPALAEAMLQARLNNQVGVTTALNNDAVRALSPSQLGDASTNIDRATSSSQSRRGSDAGFVRDQYGFGRTMQDDADADAARAALLELRRTSLTPDDATRFIESQTSMTPGARARLIQGAQGAGFPVYGPLGTGGGGTGVPLGSAPAGGTTSNAPGLTVMTGGAQLPDTIQTVGDIVSNKSALLRGNPRGTATGLYQITSDTWAEFGPKALGAEWRSANLRDPQVQDKVAESIWDQAKSSPARIKGRWEIFKNYTDEQMAAITNRPWAEVRDIVSQGESSTRASEILGGAQQQPAVGAPANPTLSPVENNFISNTVRQQIGQRAGENQANRIFPDADRLNASRDTVADVVDRLIDTKGAYRGADRGQMLSYLNRLVAMGNGRVSPALAGEMLARNVIGTPPALQQAITAPVNAALDLALGTVPRGLARAYTATADALGTGEYVPDAVRNFQGRQIETAPVGGGVRINDEGVYQQLDEYLTGSNFVQQDAQNSVGVSAQVVEAAQAAYNRAESQYQAALLRAPSQPGLRASLERLKQARDAAEQALRRVNQSAANSGTLQPPRNR